MLKKAWIKYKTKRIENKRDTLSHVDFRLSKKIALIFSVDEGFNKESTDKIIRDLRSEGKEISTFAFCKNKKKNSHNYPLFESKDISFFGDFKQEELESFMKQTYDLVFCPDIKETYQIDYLLAMIKSNCRVGMVKQGKKSHYEMMLKSEGSEVSSGLVLKYLKMIHNNEY